MWRGMRVRGRCLRSNGLESNLAECSQTGYLHKIHIYIYELFVVSIVVHIL